MKRESEPWARAFIAVARNCGSGALVIASVYAITRLGLTPAAASRPAGNRWIAVIGAPERVVGIAATSAPRTAATPFAESITRPPPNATRRSLPMSSTIAAETSGTPPEATR